MGSLFQWRKKISQMNKGYKRVQKNFNKNGISRVPHSVAPKIGLVTPCNCKHPCTYGNGRTFCFPCYQNIIAEHRAATGNA